MGGRRGNALRSVGQERALTQSWRCTPMHMVIQSRGPWYACTAKANAQARSSWVPCGCVNLRLPLGVDSQRCWVSSFYSSSLTPPRKTPDGNVTLLVGHRGSRLSDKPFGPSDFVLFGACLRICAIPFLRVERFFLISCLLGFHEYLALTVVLQLPVGMRLFSVAQHAILLLKERRRIWHHGLLI